MVLSVYIYIYIYIYIHTHIYKSDNSVVHILNPIIVFITNCLSLIETVLMYYSSCIVTDIWCIWSRYCYDAFPVSMAVELIFWQTGDVTISSFRTHLNTHHTCLTQYKPKDNP
jgi:hypothetical protein